MNEDPASALTTLQAIVAPFPLSKFRAEVLGQKPVHIPGTPEKAAQVMNWAKLNRLLGMTSIWSAASLQLALDRKIVAPEQYCRRAVGRDGRELWQPVPDKVTEFVRRGASILANDIDALDPALNAFAAAIEAELGARVQANLYCSRAERQGFDAHFDTHDVFAFHIAGEKTWNLYEGRADRPIAHPVFKTLGQPHHDRAKGRVAQEVTLRPGDLLYIPRGTYHDALARSDATIHIAFGATYPIGLDLFDLLRERAIADPLFRANLPQPQDGAALKAATEALASRIAELARATELRGAIEGLSAGWRAAAAPYRLPVAPAEVAFRKRATDLEVVRVGDRFGLKSPKGVVPIPAGQEAAMRWVLSRDAFQESEFRSSFPSLEGHSAGKFLADLARMGVIEAV
jgi:bifunctional lysine-specific demethylase and histidyl-hydroxylase MINA